MQATTMKVRRLTIGYTEHRATRGAYRTFCGKSVELASRRKAADDCEPCAYGARVAELEAEGLSTSDAQGVADAELMERLSTQQAEARAEGIDLSELHRAIYGQRAPEVA